MIIRVQYGVQVYLHYRLTEAVMKAKGLTQEDQNEVSTDQSHLP
jgi:hypothetical protein